MDFLMHFERFLALFDMKEVTSDLRVTTTVYFTYLIDS